MKTSFWILTALLALAWADIVVGAAISDENDYNEIDDDDLCDEGPPTDILRHSNLRCSCTQIYLVTADDTPGYNRLFRKIEKIPACRECTKIRRTFNGVLKFASLDTSEECAIKLAKKGYLVEENSIQETGGSQPNQPVKMQKRTYPGNPSTNSYSRNNASDVTIFILDTGVMPTHDEFQYMGNSRIIFHNDTITPETPITFDMNGHGTRCASVAVGYHIGIARNATIRSIRVADATGSANADDVIAGVNNVQEWWNSNSDKKCVVSYSMSSNTNTATINYAFGNLTLNTDCVVVVAAGNQGSNILTADACDYSPSTVPEVITVGGSKQIKIDGVKIERRFDISNYGPCVDIYAPGKAIDVAAPPPLNMLGSTSYYARSSGTSFATPAVAGAAAMILSTTTLNPTGTETMTSLVLDILENTKGLLDGLPTSGTLQSNNVLLKIDDNTYYQ
ncbi:extracellular serine proteinase-like [Lytechinus pictus]|uniref:extracellular serine proteinase-like n=1 Tax=Lytechinus pictus TaxID=7653 RepID=UPI0030BA063D